MKGLPDSRALKIFQGMAAPLLSWYSPDVRQMPWRSVPPAPYHVLVSEIMLQQTRVETVKPYFRRFIAELPSIDALAEAPEEQLLKLWEGLGYYSRVRNLQKVARVVMKEYGGQLPADRDSLLKLPGIGEYTAGAIASIAFGSPEPAVDGNVLRVCARLLSCHLPVSDPSFRKEIRERLKKVYPPGHAAEFTQSIMDLGAMVCLPATPKCGECPLREICLGFRSGEAPALPVRAKAPARKTEQFTVFLLHTQDGKTALRKRPDSGILAGLWEYPSEKGFLTVKQVRAWLEKHGLSAEKISDAGTKKHIFTHLEWDMKAKRILCRRENSEFTWATPEEIRDVYSLPGAFRKFDIQ